MKMDLFVTGTDTNVGKTVLSALLCAALDGVYWKPIQTGAREGRDSSSVKRWAELPEKRILKECYCFDAPVSPHLAACAAQCRIDLGSIRRPESKLAGPLIVEGAGGVFVPLNERDLVVDLIRHLDLPVVVAARTTLGTINHTLLTVAALRNAGLKVQGVVMMGPENLDNLRSIEHYGKVPVVGLVPPLQPIDRRGLLEAFQLHFDKQYFL